MANHSPSNYPDIGTLGEDLTAQWLMSQGWVILHRQWHSRWGEIDIVAEYTDIPAANRPANLPILAFVEVKTRSPKNWDAGGKNAIAHSKQVKICRTAQVFLSKYPQKAEYACRFDVAIVGCRLITHSANGNDVKTPVTRENLLADKFYDGHYLFLQEYIIGAFDALIS